VFTSAELKVAAEFDGTELLLSFYPLGATRVAVDPSQVTAEADGVAATLADLKYWRAGSKRGELRSVTGPLELETTGLYLSANVTPRDPKTLQVNMPTIGVAGHIEPARAVRFDRQNKVKIRFIVLNC
jgi:hypothetical protein